MYTLRFVANFLFFIITFLIFPSTKTEITFKNQKNLYKKNEQKTVKTKIEKMEYCTCDFCHEIYRKTKLHSFASEAKHEQNEKDFTFMVYIAADNDLRDFAARNIRQMAAVGSNQHVNILVHLDIKISGNQKISRFYLIEKNRILHVNMYDEKTLPMDSGNPKSLITFCAKAIQNFPASRYVLIAWNHGTGTLNPQRGRVINPSLLFNFNPVTQKLDLDRSIEYLDYICQQNSDSRGVCWDDSTGNYLTNEDLAYALEIIRHNYMDGKKFHILGFDACLMSMIEVHSLMKEHAHIMVSSQEVILGTGWNYLSLLYPFTSGTLNTKEFAYHMIASYDQAYNKITNDYTLSAIKLYKIDAVEKNIDNVGKTLSSLIKKDPTGYIKNIILKCKNKRFCTHFDEPSYIDLYHFYQNLLTFLCGSPFKNSKEIHSMQKKLQEELEEGLVLINKTIIAYTSGKNLNHAHGISIYFPEKIIHSSYRNNYFFKSNGWGTFLRSIM